MDLLLELHLGSQRGACAFATSLLERRPAPGTGSEVSLGGRGAPGHGVCARGGTGSQFDSVDD